MIEHIRAEDIFPRFLLRDRDGLAACRALEAGLNYLLARAGAGLELLDNIDTMPEWRLDEVAWETNCPYDDKADVEEKRAWVRAAASREAIMGTPAAVQDAVQGALPGALVEEWFRYGGDPYHFRLVGQGSPEAVALAEELARRSANLRSVLDNTVMGGSQGVHVTSPGGETVGGAVYPYCGETWCGE